MEIFVSLEVDSDLLRKHVVCSWWNSNQQVSTVPIFSLICVTCLLIEDMALEEELLVYKRIPHSVPF
jgi:hypothetical protein